MYIAPLFFWILTPPFFDPRIVAPFLIPYLIFYFFSLHCRLHAYSWLFCIFFFHFCSYLNWRLQTQRIQRRTKKKDWIQEYRPTEFRGWVCSLQFSLLQFSLLWEFREEPKKKTELKTTDPENSEGESVVFNSVSLLQFSLLWELGL